MTRFTLKVILCWSDTSSARQGSLKSGKLSTIHPGPRLASGGHQFCPINPGVDKLPMPYDDFPQYDFADIVDTLADLRPLSDRQLLERITRATVRLEQYMSQASDYLTTALDGLDTQLRSLQDRLQAEAAELQTAVQEAQSAAGDNQALTDAASRVKATADLVSGLALPSEVADPESPAEAGPVDQADAGGTPTPEATPTPDGTTDVPTDTTGTSTDSPVDVAPADTAPATGAGSGDANQSY